ncbi:Similar to Probable chromo domain-containing protein LHP1; acc. no. Q339W7 [Pyronema omphalodes CBS 100304]|uniref:Similar to Probable chromo domain-containing protein LHP1 acc. no. Q339W7 n=1 Tax=Pyronema omphalodes (strain CBS 100304) TaxID=1076935 RepID=U4L933_PYROM|nr:Similar to Probable chromo domain-containing protein LHP1; acc. no. Q339W7 [Pyronema omphalodes CBS 100304]
MPRATILATSGRENEKTQEKVHPDEDKLKNLFRITDPAGRVVYHVLYNDGRVLKVPARDIYSYASPATVKGYEHDNFRKGINMETRYQSKDDMGGWAGGTSAAIKKKMDRLIRETQIEAGTVTVCSESESGDSTESEDIQQERIDKVKAIAARREQLNLEQGKRTRRRATNTDFVPTPEFFDDDELQPYPDLDEDKPVTSSPRKGLSLPILSPSPRKRIPPASSKVSNNTYSTENSVDELETDIVPLRMPPAKKAKLEDSVKPAGTVSIKPTPKAPGISASKTPFKSSSQVPALAKTPAGAPVPPKGFYSVPGKQAKISQFFSSRTPTSAPRPSPSTEPAYKNQEIINLVSTDDDDDDDDYDEEMTDAPALVSKPTTTTRTPSGRTSRSVTPAAGQKRQRQASTASNLRKTASIAFMSEDELSVAPTPKHITASPRTAGTPKTAAQRRTKKASNKQRAGFYDVEKVVGSRILDGKQQYLVKWEGYEEKDNTWESLENLSGCLQFVQAYEAAKKKQGS